MFAVTGALFCHSLQFGAANATGIHPTTLSSTTTLPASFMQHDEERKNPNRKRRSNANDKPRKKKKEIGKHRERILDQTLQAIKIKNSNQKEEKGFSTEEDDPNYDTDESHCGHGKKAGS